MHQTDAADEYNEPKPYTISSDCSGDFLIYASLSRQGEPLCALMTGIVSPDPGAQIGAEADPPPEPLLRAYRAGPWHRMLSRPGRDTGGPGAAAADRAAPS